MDSARRGGNAPCAMNAANEVAVRGFLNDKIGFVEMSDLIEKVIAKTSFVAKPTLDDIMATHKEATEIAQEQLNSHSRYC